MNLKENNYKEKFENITKKEANFENLKKLLEEIKESKLEDKEKIIRNIEAVIKDKFKFKIENFITDKYGISKFIDKFFELDENEKKDIYEKFGFKNDISKYIEKIKNITKKLINL